MTVSQLLSAYTSSKLPTPPFLLLMTPLFALRRNLARQINHPAFVPTFSAFPPCRNVPAPIKDQLLCHLWTPVIICLLSPASSIFLSLMDSSNQQCLNNNNKETNILYQTVLCSALSERLTHTHVLHFLLPISFPTFPLRHSNPLELSFPSYSESPTVTPSGLSSSCPLS